MKSSGPLPLTLPHPFPIPYEPWSRQNALRSFGIRALRNYVLISSSFSKNVSVICTLDFHDITWHLKMLAFNDMLLLIHAIFFIERYSNSSIVGKVMKIYYAY